MSGGSEDTVAWASWPPTQFYVFWDDKKVSYMSKKNSDIFRQIVS